MKISSKNGPSRTCSKTGLGRKLYYAALLFLSCVSLSAIPQAHAAGQQWASLSLKVTPAQVDTGGTVNIDTEVTANRFIKIGMLIYRLTGPKGEVHYLDPIIIRDFKLGSTNTMKTIDYQVGSEDSNAGEWSVNAYLCIGKCNILGESPPKNAAVTVTGTFSVNGGSILTPTQNPGPLSFPPQ